MVRLVLLGPPGAGKGSLASLFARHLGFAHLSTGDIFRQEIARRTPLGRRVQHYVARGRLVPDPLVLSAMTAHLGAAERERRSVVLDGFPRTVGQAKGLDRWLGGHRRTLDGVLRLTSPEALLVRRLSGRRVCPRCGTNYHVRTMRPRRPGQCDRCGSRLVVRKDDQPQTIRRRLRIDHQQAAPLIQYYRRGGLLYPLDGRGQIDRVFSRAIALLRRRRWLEHDRTQDRART